MTKEHSELMEENQELQEKNKKLVASLITMTTLFEMSLMPAFMCPENAPEALENAKKLIYINS